MAELPAKPEVNDWKPVEASDWQDVNTPATFQASPEPEGFMHSLGSSLGMTGDRNPVQEFKEHPIRSMLETQPAVQAAEGLYHMAKGTGSELMSAGKDALHGNMAGAATHGVKAIPIVGPAMDKAADQYAEGDTGGEMGTLTGAAAQMAPMALGAADMAAPGRSLMGELPSRAKAGATLESLDKDLANTPVNLNHSAQPLQRATELSVRTGASPAPFNAFLSRSQGLEPMNFPEARDYQSGMSNPSIMDRLSTSGKMRGAVKQLNKNFFTDIQDAAGPRGEEYANAMRDYKNASRLNTAAKMAGAGAATAIAGPTLLRYLKPLVAE